MPKKPARFSMAYFFSMAASIAPKCLYPTSCRLSTKATSGSHHDGWFIATRTGPPSAGRAAEVFASRRAWKCLRR